MSKLASLFAQFGVQSFLNQTQTLIVLIDPGGRLQEWNAAFGRIKKTRPGVASMQGFLSTSHQTLFSEMMQAQEARQASLQFNIGLKKINLMCQLVPLPDGSFLFFAEPDQAAVNEKLAHLANDLKQAEHAREIGKIDLESVLAQANEISHTDSLTFLPNRRQIIADLQREVALCDLHKKPLTVFMLDIDDFKQVNDSYGHMAGDHVLRKLGGRLLESIREGDEVGRYGGEEFILLLPGTTEVSASKMADRLLGLVRNLEIKTDELSLKITVSIGIAEYHIGKENWEGLLKRADRAMYRSKENGRDRWTISEDS